MENVRQRMLKLVKNGKDNILHMQDHVVKLTVAEVEAAKPYITKLANCDTLEWTTVLNLKALIKDVSNEYEKVKKSFLDSRDKYLEKDSNGKPVVEQNNNLKMTPENRKKVDELYGDFLNTEIVLMNRKRLPCSKLRGAKLTANDLVFLEKILDENT